MTNQLIPIELTPEQQGKVYGILSVGGDRETAADYIGCSLTDLQNAMLRDSSFMAGVCRAEAQVELTHMRNVQTVATEKKEWRASVWWLERRSPERFGRRTAGAITVRQLKAFIAILGEALRDEAQSADERQRLAAKLQSLDDSVNSMLRDASLDVLNFIGDGDSSMSDDALGESDDSPDGSHEWLGDLG